MGLLTVKSVVVRWDQINSGGSVIPGSSGDVEAVHNGKCFVAVNSANPNLNTIDDGVNGDVEVYISYTNVANSHTQEFMCQDR